MSTQIDFLHWKNFLALEKRLIDSFYYIQPDVDNFSVYSLCYRSIILETCSDLEYASKLIFNLKGNINISKILETINKDHSDFRNIEIQLVSFSEKINPWLQKDQDSSPEFWKAYNKIKHHGGIKEATLDITMNALAALFSILLVYYRENIKQICNIDEPSLFYYPNVGAENIILSQSYNIKLPGFD